MAASKFEFEHGKIFRQGRQAYPKHFSFKPRPRAVCWVFGQLFAMAAQQNESRDSSVFGLSRFSFCADGRAEQKANAAMFQECINGCNSSHKEQANFTCHVHFQIGGHVASTAQFKEGKIRCPCLEFVIQAEAWWCWRCVLIKRTCVETSATWHGTLS